MKAVPFNGQNRVLGEDQPQYNDLPIFCDPLDDEGKVYQVWQLDDDEIKRVIETKKIHVVQLTFKHPLQPILLSVDPLVNPEVNEN